MEARAFRPAKNAASKGAFRHGAPGSDFLKHTVANPVVLLPQPDGNYPRGSHAPPFAEPASRALLPLGYRGRSAPLPGAGGSTGLQPSQYGFHKIPVFSPRRLNLKGAPPLSPFLGDRVGSTRYIQMPRCPICAGFARNLPSTSMPRPLCLPVLLRVLCASVVNLVFRNCQLSKRESLVTFVSPLANFLWRSGWLLR